MTAALFALVLASVSLNALAQVALRKAMTFQVLPPLAQPVALATSMAVNPWLWAGIACYAVSILLWLSVLSRMEVCAAYPMLSIGYVLAAAMGVLFLGESFDGTRAAGIALICAGVVVIGRSA